MCGRFTLTVGADVLAEYFGLLEEPDLYSLVGRRHPRWNIAPTQRLLVVEPMGEARGGAWAAMQWGATQSFSRGRPLFNARGDRLKDRFWRRSFEQRRCLVPVTSFYEWQDVGTKRRLPYEIRPARQPVAAFAAVWDEILDRESGELIRWCAIITTDACPLLRDIHNAGANRHRQPAFVDREDLAAWLAPGPVPAGVTERVLRVRDSNEFQARALEALGDDEEPRPPQPKQEVEEGPGAPDVHPGDQPSLPFA